MKKSTFFTRLSFRFKLTSAFPKEKGKASLGAWLKAAAGAEAVTVFWQKETRLSEKTAVTLLGFFTGFLAGRSVASPDRQSLGLYMAARMRASDRAAFREDFLEGVSLGLHTPHKKERIEKALSSLSPDTEESLIRETAESMV